MKFNPLTKTEMKILVFNKVKQGMSYDKAVSELNMEIKKMEEIYVEKYNLDKNAFDDLIDLNKRI